MKDTKNEKITEVKDTLDCAKHLQDEVDFIKERLTFTGVRNKSFNLHRNIMKMVG